MKLNLDLIQWIQVWDVAGHICRRQTQNVETEGAPVGMQVELDCGLSVVHEYAGSDLGWEVSSFSRRVQEQKGGLQVVGGRDCSFTEGERCFAER